MPSLFDCPNCGRGYWNLEPHPAAKFMCSSWLIEGKFCPHCRARSPYEVSDDVYLMHQKEIDQGKWGPTNRRLRSPLIERCARNRETIRHFGKQSLTRLVGGERGIRALGYGSPSICWARLAQTRLSGRVVPRVLPNCGYFRSV